MALVQAGLVEDLIRKSFPEIQLERKIIQTSGDRFQKEKLADVGGKGLFVKEIEEALLSHHIDFAVHSLKDVPGILPKGLVLAAFLKRGDPRDVWVSKNGESWEVLPKGSVVGTSSPRREVQLRSMQKDWELKALRGNVETRLRKLETGEYDAIVLAAAGLHRLNLSRYCRHYFSTDLLLPAVGQGIVVIETRKEELIIDLLREACGDAETTFCAKAERAFLATMGGDCHTPLAGHATLQGEQIQLKGWLALPEGPQMVSDEIIGSRKEAFDLGRKLAERMLEGGGKEIIIKIRKLKLDRI